MKAYIVEKADLEQNLRILQRKAGKALIWGVLKGNGYGLGTVPLARLLAAHGIDHFAVTELQEARGLREAGFSENPILMLRGVSEMEELDALLEPGDAVLVKASRFMGLERVVEGLVN